MHLLDSFGLVLVKFNFQVVFFVMVAYTSEAG